MSLKEYYHKAGVMFGPLFLALCTVPISIANDGFGLVTWTESVPDKFKKRVEHGITNIFHNGYGGEVMTWGHDSRKQYEYAFAALKAGGEVMTWGEDSQGGDSSKVESKLSSNVTTIFHNKGAFAALKAGGEVVTWGSSKLGGDSSKVESKLSSNVTTIFHNLDAFAALKAGGEVVTWGDAKYGGDSSRVQSKLSSDVTTIFHNLHAFAALKAGGEVVTWGNAKNGGDSSKLKSKLRSDVTTIFHNYAAFAALKAGGEVVTWGSLSHGGDSSKVESKLSGNVTTIFHNGFAFAALKAGGEVVTWGYEKYGGDSLQESLTLTSGRVKSVISLPKSFAAFVCIPHISTRKQALDCDSCRLDEIWAGLELHCQRCQYSYQVPNASQTGCNECKIGSAAHGTHCSPCVGNTFAPSRSEKCQDCPTGEVPNANKASCETCNPNQITEDGICKSCQSLSKPNQSKTECILDPVAMLYWTIYILLVFSLPWSLIAISSTKIRLIDVALTRGQTILTTARKHHLSCPSCRPSFPITIHDTGHVALDAKHGFTPKAARAKVVGDKRLELLDVNGDSIDDRLDTSKGFLRLTYADMIVHRSLSGIPVAILASIILLSILLFASIHLEGDEAIVMGLGSFFVSFLFWEYVKRRKLSMRTPLQKRLDEFGEWISKVNPNPSACPKGPGRAIRLDKLLETHSAFSSFILDRSAYYLNANILMPLTAKHRLSYAELLGPEQVHFFVSHYWGTEFRHLCSSLQKHAEAVWKAESAATLRANLSNLMGFITPEGTPSQRHFMAYWICFCSNNQYDVANELGSDDGWQQSSFYLTLQSPTCRSTCMVLDDKALPLTRSWCIFETLQTLKLASTRPGFELLMCTESGVLNFGNASIEAAISVVKGVVRMDLRDAQASVKEDKEMIDRLVLEEVGTFDKMNDFVSDELHTILQKSQETSSTELQNLFQLLESSRLSRQKSRLNISPSRPQAVEDEGMSELRTPYGKSMELSTVPGQAAKRDAEARAEVLSDVEEQVCTVEVPIGAKFNL